MKLECILKRNGGTIAEIGGVDYHFSEQADGAHVADVEETAHIERFLAIPEAYRIYREPKAEQAQGGDLASEVSDSDAEQKPARRTRKKAEQAQDGAE